MVAQEQQEFGLPSVASATENESSLVTVTMKTEGQLQSSSEYKLANHAQILQFLNDVFLPFNPYNDALYEEQYLSTSDIRSVVAKHVIDTKSIPGDFPNWCTRKNAAFLEVKSNLARDSGNQKRIRKRRLYTLLSRYHATIVQSITETLIKHQRQIQAMKDSGIIIVGYARKSKTPEKDCDRVRLLQEMTLKLQSRSLADRIYVSPRTSSDELLRSRDMPRPQSLLDALNNVNGTTQDLFELLATTTSKICLVAIDFAGLSTNENDIYELIKYANSYL
ncbi:hypothetical protein DFQ28_001193 [Apophysomyces sp. BC1034]|nr:hypothetical protein DFQ30_001927 [Apophysomyces sp. BC1015]KAG0166666.1 hypothetical protein DFQ29_000885 [Apophysomyces sp. BC1021]KAG0166667.1 hypothetical protein DFQ29_000886 [Apophysomyces sp. BC1021]KAG0183704.1 hypothetical protein DFQ28_001193 [Apophysomyces sp. BC1034]